VEVKEEGVDRIDWRKREKKKRRMSRQDLRD